MKIKKMLGILILLLITVQNLSSQSTKDIVDKIDSFYNSNTSLKGDFELQENKVTSKGYFVYKAPFFKMVFSSEKGNEEYKKRIISDGKVLWIYLPKLSVVIEQDLKNFSSSGITTQMLGIRRILSQYNYKFKDNDPNPKSVPGLTSKVNILVLTPKDTWTGFKKILFYVREDGFVAKSVAETKKNRYVLIRKNVILNPEVNENEFKREVPKNTRLIKNPFVSD